MNAKQILTIFVISLLIFLSSCNSMKRQIDPYQEKIGKKVMITHCLIIKVKGRRLKVF